MTRRHGTAAVLACVVASTIALAAPAHASPSVDTSTLHAMRDVPAASDGDVSANAPEAAPAVVARHVHARLTRFDEAEVTWDAADGPAPAGFVVRLDPDSDAAPVSVAVAGRVHATAVPGLPSSTRFHVHVLVVDVDGVAKAPIAGEDVVTRSKVQAVLDTAHEAAAAEGAAEDADRHAFREEARAQHLHGHARTVAREEAKRAASHAGALHRAAALAEQEYHRARNRLEHTDAATG